MGWVLPFSICILGLGLLIRVDPLHGFGSSLDLSSSDAECKGGNISVALYSASVNKEPHSQTKLSDKHKLKSKVLTSILAFYRTGYILWYVFVCVCLYVCTLPLGMCCLLHCDSTHGGACSHLPSSMSFSIKYCVEMNWWASLIRYFTCWALSPFTSLCLFFDLVGAVKNQALVSRCPEMSPCDQKPFCILLPLINL